MIVGIGTDIVEIARISSLLSKRGEVFAHKILSSIEMKEFAAQMHPEIYLAKRWAAKEAIAKALGTGFSNGVTFGEMTIGHTDLGQPLVKLHGKTLALSEERQIKYWSISISDEKHYAIAFVVAEAD
ncbi:holo-ACP synthase [Hydrogenovibrio kuenenii]|uniref:holo-ACP synthase n=1 Tax=Hydrogenovibrio kuenenii TaxID=63658 RepID=UPI00046774FB|nr:holo-ACP synthase [Hydrogenovibrio kuenenii]